MSRFFLAAVTTLAVLAPGRADDPPLPAGAVARIGGTGISHPSHLRDYSFSPDGKTIATIGDAIPRIWDVATGRLLRELSGHNGVGVAVAFSPDGRRFVSAAGEPGVLVWDTATWKPLGRIPSDAASAVAFTPDGQTLAVLAIGTRVRGIELFDVESRAKLRAVERSDRTDQFAFSPDGRTLAATGSGKAVVLYEVATGQVRAQVEKTLGVWSALAFTPAGHLLVTGHDSKLKAVDPLTGKDVKTYDATAVRVAVSPNGQTIAAVAGKGNLCLLDAATGKELRKWAAQPGPMQKLTFSPDGKRIASTGWKHNRVHIYDADTGKELGAGGHDAAVIGVALSPDGTKMVTSGDDHTLRFWSLAVGQPPRELRRIDVPIEYSYHALAFSPDGTKLAGGAAISGTMFKMVRVWEFDTAKELLALQGLTDSRGAGLPMGCHALAFSPDGTKLASGGVEAGFHIWDVVTGRELARHGGGTRANFATGLAYSADGSTVYVTTWSGGVAAWDLSPQPEKLVRPFEGPQARCVAVAKAAKIVAAGGTSGTLWVWDAVGKPVFQGTGHGGPMSAVAVTADGRYVAGAGSDSVVRVWDVETGQVRAEYKGHRGRVNGLAFAPDGRLVSVAGDGVVLVWASTPVSEHDRMWGDLGGSDAARAFKAIGELVAQPDRSVPYLALRLPKPDTPRVRVLVERLSGKDAGGAFEELARLGSLVEPDLRRARDAAAEPAKAQLVKLLDAKGPAAWPNEGLRLTRAVEALERIGTPAARGLLQKVVTDWKDTAPGRDAAESLERLSGKKP